MIQIHKKKKKSTKNGTYVGDHKKLYECIFRFFTLNFLNAIRLDKEIIITLYANSNHKRVGMTILILDKIDFKTRNITRNKGIQ